MRRSPLCRKESKCSPFSRSKFTSLGGRSRSKQRKRGERVISFQFGGQNSCKRSGAVALLFGDCDRFNLEENAKRKACYLFASEGESAAVRSGTCANRKKISNLNARTSRFSISKVLGVDSVDLLRPHKRQCLNITVVRRQSN